MNAQALADAVLEGEDPKEFLRRASAAKIANSGDFDTFITAYYEAMLWSTSLPPYGTCPICGLDDQVLDRWDEDQTPVCRACSEREPNHEPPGDDNYTFAELSDELKQKSERDCRAFMQANMADLMSVERVNTYPAMEMAGHDFWLTRCGHGVGFNDRDEWGEDVKERLHDAAQRFGEVYIEVGDDGKIY